MATPTAPIPVQIAYAVPTGKDFKDKERKTKLIVLTTNCYYNW